MFAETKFDEYKPQYDQLSDEKKNRLKAIFEETPIMESKHILEMWITENCDDEEFIAETFSQLQAFLAENQP